MSLPQAASKPGTINEGVMRFLTEVKKNLTPRRQMSTVERRALQQRAAKDPNVERAVQEVLAAHPELRRRDATEGGIQGRSD